jgi:hypothetical protein
VVTQIWQDLVSGVDRATLGISEDLTECGTGPSMTWRSARNTLARDRCLGVFAGRPAPNCEPREQLAIRSLAGDFDKDCLDVRGIHQRLRRSPISKAFSSIFGWTWISPVARLRSC